VIPAPQPARACLYIIVIDTLSGASMAAAEKETKSKEKKKLLNAIVYAQILYG